jgi:hypothetical protein
MLAGPPPDPFFEVLLKTKGLGIDPTFSRTDHRFTTKIRLVMIGAVQTETLAQKLGTHGHGSRLLLKARQAGLHGPQELVDEAIARGCYHYLQGRMPPLQKVSLEAFSNAELALALLTPANLYDPWLIRVGAMLLGAEDNDPAQIAELSAQENCGQVVRAVAEAGGALRAWDAVLANPAGPAAALPPAQAGRSSSSFTLRLHARTDGAAHSRENRLAAAFQAQGFWLCRLTTPA